MRRQESNMTKWIVIIVTGASLLAGCSSNESATPPDTTSTTVRVINSGVRSAANETAADVVDRVGREELASVCEAYADALAAGAAEDQLYGIFLQELSGLSETVPSRAIFDEMINRC